MKLQIEFEDKNTTRCGFILLSAGVQLVKMTKPKFIPTNLCLYRD